MQRSQKYNHTEASLQLFLVQYDDYSQRRMGKNDDINHTIWKESHWNPRAGEEYFGLNSDRPNNQWGEGGGRGYSDFCLLQGLWIWISLCFWVSRFCQILLWVCQFEKIFFRYVSFHRYCFGCQFKNIDFIVFRLYKVQKSFGLCLVNIIKTIIRSLEAFQNAQHCWHFWSWYFWVWWN